MKETAGITLASLIFTLAAAAGAGGDLPPLFEIKNAEIAYYSISGSTPEELRAEMKRKGPRGWHAYTDWNLAWNCREVTVTCTVTMPSWDPENPDPGLRKRFRVFWNNLAAHEQGHVDILTRSVDAAKKRVRSMDCFSAGLAWADTLRKITRESEEYDRVTGHGQTQGAVF
ncbi:MAG TPA: DUF922 domain-containing protein [Spirochaetota bacterium]|nr:DUF922 domain-containing protein [Spirochaetota bacterium]HPC42870.1 DUF922 domain-containing protein [Spirochaetota bacterium]HPL16795.1 DUF922 domain-containing protein [Spirochaetota bacterium]HQF07142.1 DUF922 domain-containing protein [Spirochaetota bacterium]HQH95879.1 DUF922 domain-containing protein [Spirochaetota bacterium]